MAVKSSGLLSMSADIATEFQDDPDHSLSEFYGDSPSLPLSGEISFSDFYGTIRNTTISYEAIGGGGGGGRGYGDGGGSTFAESGFLSSITYSDVITRQAQIISAAGGAGGGNGNGSGSGAGGTPGDDSFYGSGPAYGQAAVNYGTGGYGGSGDNKGPDYDGAGAKGSGGGAGTYLNGTFIVAAGDVIQVVVGTGGNGTWADGNFRGGDAANGFVRLTINGVITEFTQNGSITIPG